jgi:hypothetical protein
MMANYLTSVTQARLPWPTRHRLKMIKHPDFSRNIRISLMSFPHSKTVQYDVA